MDRDFVPPPAAGWLRAGGEGLFIGLATLSAWPFGSVHPHFEYLLAAGVSLLAACWAVHAALTRRFTFRLDLVSAALAGLILLTVFQLVPLPLAVTKAVSPSRGEWHESFIPERLERLPGEPETPRPAVVPLSVQPHATRTLAARLIALLAVYATARNWLADRDTLRRFAWAAVLNGVLLALVGVWQFFASKPGVVFGTFETGGAVFGPFICRNHYPDYLAFAVAGAVYLMHPRKGERTASASGTWRERLFKLLDVFDRPTALGAALAIALLLASVPFSQSRGGVVSVAAGGVFAAALGGWRKRGGSTVGTLLGLTAAVGVGLALWLGIGPITERFQDDGKTLDDRLPLWASGAKHLPGLWAAGGGGGTFAAIEPLGRTTQGTTPVFDHAHNEYLEAAVEGGVIRLGLTLLLGVGVPVMLAVRYRRLRGRSAGAFVLGVGFAAVVLAVHSAFDFAIHLPAVAVMAAAAVGLAMGAGSEQSSGSRLTFLFPLLLTLAAGVAALDARSRWRADELRLAAEATDDPTTRLEWQARRTRVAPTDSTAWYDLAQARFAVGDTAPALAALRTARDLCPLSPDVQFSLGLHARQFESADPPATYFRRATRVLPTDPDAWFALGVTEMEGGNREAAEASWRRSLELGPRRLKPILTASAGLPAEALRDRVLADDPAVLMLAAGERPAGERRVFVEAAAKAATRDGPLTASQLAAAATACDELDKPDAAAAMWHRATAADPTSRELRDRAARWFEQQERYADAIPHLEWLSDRYPANANVDDRLAAARHGAELKRVIGR